MAGSGTRGNKKRASTRRVKPGSCKIFLQNELADALPDTIPKLVERMKEGDLSVMKTLWQMSDLDKEEVQRQVGKKSSSLAKQLLKRLKEYETDAAKQKKYGETSEEQDE